MAAKAGPGAAVPAAGGAGAGPGRLGGVWSNMKVSLGNLGSCGTPRRLAAIMKNRLKRSEYRPALIDGFLAQVGLSLEPL